MKDDGVVLCIPPPLCVSPLYPQNICVKFIFAKYPSVAGQKTKKASPASADSVAASEGARPVAAVFCNLGEMACRKRILSEYYMCH